VMVARASWVVSGLCTLALVAVARPAAPQFVPLAGAPGNGRNILEGHWQSCREPGGGGRYSERVYDHVVNGIGQFEVHLGPRREFAVFLGVQDEHREHDSPDNLLQPYRVEMEGTRASKRWEIASLNLVFTAALGGGSRTDCDNWYILLAPLEKSSH